MTSDLEVDGEVEGLPDEEALDEAAAGKTVFVHVDAVQTAVCLVLSPGLVLVWKLCSSIIISREVLLALPSERNLPASIKDVSHLGTARR